jgi:hypothetical protein
VQAFASNPVITEMQECSTVHERAMTAFSAWPAAGASGETSRVVDEAQDAAENGRRCCHRGDTQGPLRVART